MLTFQTISCCVLLTFLALTWASGEDGKAPQPKFTITDIGTLGNGESYATAINERGQVLGSISIPDENMSGGPKRHFYLWEQGRMKDLGVKFIGYGLSNSSEVVGASVPDDLDPLDPLFIRKFHPVLYDGQKLNYFLGRHVSGGGRAVNNYGQIVGSRQDFADVKGQHPSIQSRPFLWKLGELQYLPVPPEYAQGIPSAINDKAEVVGILQTASPSGSLALVKSAALWKQNRVILLGTLPGSDQSEAVAVNNRGVILCKAFFGGDILDSLRAGRPPTGGKFTQRGFVWDEGRIQDIAVSSRGIDITKGNLPRALNDHGQVVGQASGGNGGNAAFLWQDGVIENLNDFVPADSGWILTDATGINNKGMIVGNGKHNGLTRAFLLSPIP